VTRGESSINPLILWLHSDILNVQKSAGKLAGQYVDQDSDEPKKKRSRVVKTVRPSVMSRFCGVDSTTVKKAEIFNFYAMIQKMALNIL